MAWEDMLGEAVDDTRLVCSIVARRGQRASVLIMHDVYDLQHGDYFVRLLRMVACIQIRSAMSTEKANMLR